MILPIIVANFKANLNLKESAMWFSRAVPHLKAETHVEIVVCPTFLSLETASSALVGTQLYLGAQSVSPFPHGKYTGEVPADLLRGVVRFAIVGHSERRKYFGEDNHLVAEKVKRLEENKIKPIVCVENTDDASELSNLLKTRDLIVAYEPTFAIGTGTPDTPENAQKVAEGIKLYFGENTPVLYGGSVTAENIQTFLAQKSIGGALVGGASLNPEDFVALVRAAS